MIQGCFVAVGIFSLPVAQPLDEDVIGILQDAYLFAGNVAQDTYSQTRTRERMAVDHLSGKTEGNAEFTDFVLKEAAQRFKKLQMKRVGQAAHIVVALNNLSFFGFCTGRLNHVRVDRALSKPFGVFDFGSFFLEDVDEFTADDLTLLLGICLLYTSDAADEL